MIMKKFFMVFALAAIMGMFAVSCNNPKQAEVAEEEAVEVVDETCDTVDTVTPAPEVAAE